MDMLDIGVYQDLLQTLLAWAEVHGIRILIILVAAYILRRMAITALKKFFSMTIEHRKEDLEACKRLTTLENFTRMVISTAIILLLIILLLWECGIEIGPILAAAGVFGLAISFGAQHLVQDVISGFFILYDNQIREGDTIKVGDKTGTVERLNLRVVVLRALDGSLHYIRSGQLGPITNMTQDFSYYVFEIVLSYDSKLEEVFKVISEVSDQMLADPATRGDILAPIEVFGLDRFDNSAMIIKGRIKSRPQQQWALGRRFNLKLKMAFDEASIDIHSRKAPFTLKDVRTS